MAANLYYFSKDQCKRLLELYDASADSTVLTTRKARSDNAVAEFRKTDTAFNEGTLRSALAQLLERRDMNR